MMSKKFIAMHLKAIFKTWKNEFIKNINKNQRKKTMNMKMKKNNYNYKKLK